MVLELEQSRTLDAARGVADGRLDFAIIREDAAPAGMKCWSLGSIGYAIFAPKAAWKGGSGIESVFSKCAFGELLPGGQFSQSYSELRAAKVWTPRVVARVGSFQQLARLVHGVTRAEVTMVVLVRFLGRYDGPRWWVDHWPQPLRSRRVLQHAWTILRRNVVARLKVSGKSSAFRGIRNPAIKNLQPYDLQGFESGTPGGTRTPNLLIRSQTIYPIDLRVHRVTAWADKKPIFSEGVKNFGSDLRKRIA